MEQVATAEDVLRHLSLGHERLLKALDDSNIRTAESLRSLSKQDLTNMRFSNRESKRVLEWVEALKQIEEGSWICDSCRITYFGGPRHRCIDCPDFDLCESCFRTASHYADHSFVELAYGEVEEDGDVLDSIFPMTVDDVLGAMLTEDALITVEYLSDDFMWRSVPAAQHCDEETCDAAMNYLIPNADLIAQIILLISSQMIDGVADELAEANLPAFMLKCINEEKVAADAVGIFATICHRYSHHYGLNHQPNKEEARKLHELRITALAWSCNQSVIDVRIFVLLELERLGYISHRKRKIAEKVAKATLKAGITVAQGLLVAFISGGELAWCSIM